MSNLYHNRSTLPDSPFQGGARGPNIPDRMQYRSESSSQHKPWLSLRLLHLLQRILSRAFSGLFRRGKPSDQMFFSTPKPARNTHGDYSPSREKNSNEFLAKRQMLQRPLTSACKVNKSKTGIRAGHTTHISKDGTGRYD